MKNTFNSRLLLAEVLQHLRRPAIYLVIGLSWAADLVLSIQLANTQQFLDLQSTFYSITLLEIAMLVWAAHYGASAYESGSITRFVFHSTSKARAFLIRLLSALIASFFAIVALSALSVMSTIVVISMTHVPFKWGEIHWQEDVRIVAVIAWLTLLGFFVGSLTRNAALANGAVLSTAFAPAICVLLAAPYLAEYMPLQLAARFVSGSGGNGDSALGFAEATIWLLLGLVVVGTGGYLRAISRKTKKA